MKFVVFPILMILLSFCQTASETSEDVRVKEGVLNDTVSVSFCELLDNPGLYDGREVQTTAILLTGFESAFLYDPTCVSNEKLVWFEVENDSVNEELGKYLRPETPEFRKVGLNRVNGRFLGTFQTKKDKGFGHLNSSNYKLTIKAVEDLSSVSDKVAYPW